MKSLTFGSVQVLCLCLHFAFVILHIRKEKRLIFLKQQMVVCVYVYVCYVSVFFFGGEKKP